MMQPNRAPGGRDGLIQLKKAASDTLRNTNTLLRRVVGKPKNRSNREPAAGLVGAVDAINVRPCMRFH